MTPAERALAVDKLLREEHGAPFEFFSHRDPLSELINALLSHRTKNAVTRAAFLNLRRHYPTWEEIIKAPTDEVEQAIKAVTYPEVKAPRIQEVLRRVRARREGELSLDFLADWPVDEARDWLEEMPGVGAKTGAAVLNFSRLRLPALVVDTHHQRVAQRIGLVPEKASLKKVAERLQSFVPEDWDGQRVYDHHEAFMYHGQRVCHWRRPDCGNCVVRELCDYGRE